MYLRLHTCLSLIVNMSIDLWAVMVEEGVQRDQQIFSSIVSLYICVFLKKTTTHDCPLLIKCK